VSANIYFERVNPKKAKSLGVGAPSSFLKAMQTAGMEIPCNVGHAHWEKINAMAAVYGDNDDNPFRKLANLILELPDDGELRLWAEY
jgi:phage major head subunit gpT-like protein